MIRKLNNILLTNAPLKIISLLVGYSFWYIFGSAHTISIWLTIPLCFYAVPEQINITAPEQVTIKISGKREYLRLLDINKLAAHINAQQLSSGIQKIMVNEEMLLLLPDTIKLVHCYPITVEVTQKLDYTKTAQQDIAQGLNA